MLGKEPRLSLLTCAGSDPGRTDPTLGCTAAEAVRESDAQDVDGILLLLLGVEDTLWPVPSAPLPCWAEEAAADGDAIPPPFWRRATAQA